jgi:hypothetical protein
MRGEEVARVGRILAQMEQAAVAADAQRLACSESGT